MLHQSYQKPEFLQALMLPVGYQIPLNKVSQELINFLIPFGRYCFRRLLIEITSAPQIFMLKMSQLFEGVGVFC